MRTGHLNLCLRQELGHLWFISRLLHEFFASDARRDGEGNEAVAQGDGPSYFIG